MQKKLDNLGRVVIPQGFRKQLNLKSDDFIEIDFIGHEIIIKKSIFKNRFDYIIEKILIPLYKSYNYTILLTDKDKVLYAINKKIIGFSITNVIENYFETIPEIYNELYIADYNELNIKGKVYLIPILESGYKIGVIIIKVSLILLMMI